MNIQIKIQRAHRDLSKIKTKFTFSYQIIENDRNDRTIFSH